MSLPERDGAASPGTSTFKDVRMRGFQDRTDLLEAQAVVLARTSVLPGEEVPLDQAAGRVLAEEVVAELNIPPFDRSAMDGYAVSGRATLGASAAAPLDLLVSGTSLPGRPCEEEVRPGTAVRIMTGAPLPRGADAVIPVELVAEVPARSAGEAPRVRLLAGVHPGRHVVSTGEDVAAGSVVLPAGRVLRPQDLGVLASLGASPVRVRRRPRVTILITGDELLPCGSKPEGYRIVDSISVMLKALIERDGGVVEHAQLLPDRPELLRQAVAGCRGDILLISGGSSVGQEDHAALILAELGEVCFHGVALRPAGPAGFGLLRGSGCLVFLMPGNPVSSLCAHDLLTGMAVRKMAGRSPGLPHRQVTLPLADRITSAVGRVDYVRVQIRDGAVEPLAAGGASSLTSTTRADGFILVPRDRDALPADEAVNVYLYDQ